MHVQRQIRDAADGGDDRNTDRDIRNENAVHDVYMDIIHAGFRELADVALQIDKIGGKNGRGNFDHDKTS